MEHLPFSSCTSFPLNHLCSKDRFGKDGYCLSAESSLDVYAAQNIISRQLVVMTKKPSNQTIKLPHDTSLLLYSDKKNFPATISKKDRLNLIPLPEAICRATPSYFQNNNLNAEICLKLVPSAAEISRVLLTLQSPTAAARVAGAYIRVGDRKWADQITRDMAATGQTINPSDPFSKKPLCLGGIERLASPYAGRIGAMWRRMRDVVIDSFPAPPSHRDSEKKSLSMIEKLYTEDAYHSLSIEGYQVTEDLIRRIKEGAWNPDAERADNEQRNALAAKGYLGAFNAVTASVRKVFEGDHPGKVLSADLQTWYRELFAPLVQTRLMNPSDLAGYRNHPVYIAKSRHVPPPAGAVLDSMAALEKLLIEEPNAAVRAVLGHFIFVFIHPYMDGNGRIGRFIMNLMLISGGYNWTVIRISERARYMASLEKASAQGEIEDFTAVVASEMEYWKNEVSRRDRTPNKSSR
ncbi:MAG: Fic family protein [Deltaproteobacteria bacterium]|nr:Fic family protein [Deltaproteobacteria bacterium]